jgi:hypothetical protein
LFVVPIPAVVISTTSEPPVGLLSEVFGFLRQSGPMVCTNQPRCHPVLLSRSRQVGHTGIDVIPSQPTATTFAQRCLNIGIKLAQVVECSRRFDG